MQRFASLAVLAAICACTLPTTHAKRNSATEHASSLAPSAKLAAAHSVRLVWRETLAQSFDTPDGRWRAGAGGCVAVRSPGNLHRLNQAVSARVASAGVAVLPAFRLSLSYWADHLERHSAYAKGLANPACTHFCEPSALFDRLSASVVAMLSS